MYIVINRLVPSFPCRQNFNNNSRPTHDGDYNDGLLDVYGEGLNSDFRETPWKKPSPGGGRCGGGITKKVRGVPGI